MEYGQLPKLITNLELDIKEMMFYQYLPIKLSSSSSIIKEKRLNVFNKLIDSCINDFILSFGYYELLESNVYLTVKRNFQSEGTTFNRFGWHSDGFLTNDINYIWSDNNGTIFNTSNLTLNDEISLIEMNEQANQVNNIIYNDFNLIRLNQFNIHKVKHIDKPCFRTFFKLSFSRDKYDLIGNSKNYELDYDWEMRDRKINRNIPQSI